MAFSAGAVSDGSFVCRFEVEEKVNKLEQEVEALSQSEQMAAESQTSENERVIWFITALSHL